MLNLILVRHGQTAWNNQQRYQGHTDVPLNAVGRQQAERTAIALQRFNATALYSSDLRRAWEMAGIIGAALDLTPESAPRLREINFGVFEGLTFAGAQQRYPQMMAVWLTDQEQPPAHGEPYTAFAARLHAFITDVQRNHADQTVIAVGHGGSLREILRSALGLPAPQGQWYFTLENASISELALYDDLPLLKRLNLTCHLQE